MARQYDRSVEELKKAIELDPSSYIPHFYLVYPYIMKGMHEEAIAEAQKALELSGKAPIMIGVLASAYAFAGKETEVKRLLNEAIKLSKQMYISSFGISQIYLGLEDKDKALEWLEKAFEERDHWMYQLKVSPLLDSLRSDPRFKKLLQKMGLDK